MSEASSPGVPLWQPTIAITAAICAPLCNFLAHHSYPLLSAPVGLILTAIVALSLVAAWIEIHGPRVISSLPLALATTFAVDFLVVDGMWMLIAVFAAAFAFSFLARPNSYTIVTMAFVSMTLVVLGEAAMKSGPAMSAARGPAETPGRVIVHLILDEHIGLEGIPLDIEGGAEVRKLIGDFYARHGFRLHSRAYSRHFLTKDSLPSMVNYSSSSGRELYLSALQKGQPRAVTRNAYFDKTRENGFDIHVYQSDVLRFCGPSSADDGPEEVELCSSYRANSIGSLPPFSFDTGAEALFIVNSLVQQSLAYTRAQISYREVLRPRLHASLGLELPSWGTAGHRVGPIAARPVLEDIVADALTPQGDVLIFAHLLTPHYPYVYRGDCKARPISTWMDRSSSREMAPRTATAPPSLPSNSDQSRRARYTAYFEQLTCLYSDLSDMMQALESSSVWDNLTLILHGDHGSRITRYDPMVRHRSLLSDADLLDSWSTLYAIKAPGIEGGVEPTPAPLDRLLPMQPAERSDAGPADFYYLKSGPHGFERVNGSPFDGVGRLRDRS